MARINFSLGAVHIQIDGGEAPRVAPARRASNTGATLVTPTDGTGAVPASAAGPGWFESSWELVRGLEVREGLPGDAQLHEWIEGCLRTAPLPELQFTVC